VILKALVGNDEFSHKGGFEVRNLSAIQALHAAGGKATYSHFCMHVTRAFDKHIKFTQVYWSATGKL
jgi:hypothetical protein